MSEKTKIDKVISAYITLRDSKDAIKTRHTEELAEVNGKMNKLQGWLHLQMNTLGTDKLGKKGIGIAYIETRSRAKVNDWEELWPFIQEDPDERQAFLEKRVSKSVVDNYIEVNEGALPPGVGYSSEQIVRVRKAA